MRAHGWTASLAVVLVACNALSGVGDLDFDGDAAGDGHPDGSQAATGGAGGDTAATATTTSASAGGSGGSGASGPVTWTFGEGAADHDGVTSDTRIFEQSPTHANGASYLIGVDSEAGAAKVALVRFDVSAIPTSATVLGATLHLVTSGNADCQANAGNSVQMFRMLEAWQEGDEVRSDGVANWTERLPFTQWMTPGAGPGSREVAAFAELAPLRLAMSYDVTLPEALVGQWVSSPETNFGFAMLMNPGAGGDGACFESSESPVVDSRPMLSVTFH